MKNYALAAVLLLALASCADKRDRMQTTGPTLSIPVPMGLRDEVPPERLETGVSGSTKPLVESANAVQQNMQALVGASIGKLSDQLLRLETTLSASVTANAALEARLEAKLEAQLSAHAALEAKVSALAAGQIGYGNELQSSIKELRQELSAGRDLTNSNTEFSVEMLNALKSSNETTIKTAQLSAGILLAIITACSTIVGLTLRGSRIRADARAREALDRSIKPSS